MKRPAWLNVPTWEMAIVVMSDHSRHFAVVDPAREGESDYIKAITGRAEENAEGRADAQAMAALFASLPTNSAFMAHVVRQLEDLVRQYPEGPNNRTPAGAAARDTLHQIKQLNLLEKVMQAPSNPNPKGKQ